MGLRSLLGVFAFHPPPFPAHFFSACVLPVLKFCKISYCQRRQQALYIHWNTLKSFSSRIGLLVHSKRTADNLANFADVMLRLTVCDESGIDSTLPWRLFVPGTALRIGGKMHARGNRRLMLTRAADPATSGHDADVPAPFARKKRQQRRKYRKMGRSCKIP